MNSQKLRTVLKKALAADGDLIRAHIAGLGDGAYGGIEGVFETAFKRELGLLNAKQLSCHAIGTKNYFAKRSRGLIDLVFPDTCDYNTAFEFKAVRMPRIKGDCGFDVYQIASDFLRLSRATRIEFGWIVAFVYGPMVDDAQSSRDLFRRFHNQMFVETMLARESRRLGNLQIRAARNLGWNAPLEKAMQTDSGFAIMSKTTMSQKPWQNKSVGAICLQAK
jgi:hypothetical protein